MRANKYAEDLKAWNDNGQKGKVPEVEGREAASILRDSGFKPDNAGHFKAQDIDKTLDTNNNANKFASLLAHNIARHGPLTSLVIGGDSHDHGSSFNSGGHIPDNTGNVRSK